MESIQFTSDIRKEHKFLEDANDRLYIQNAKSSFALHLENSSFKKAKGNE